MVEIIDPHEEMIKDCREMLKSTKPGDGVTVNYYTDSHAYTVISRTAKTLRIQRDKATLADAYKPEFIPGGFAAHCTNNSSQHYDYARNPEGVIKTAYWSESSGCFRVGGAMVVTPGRHEFYDYNF